MSAIFQGDCNFGLNMIYLKYNMAVSAKGGSRLALCKTMFKLNLFKKKEQPAVTGELKPETQAPITPEAPQVSGVENVEENMENVSESSRSAEEMEKELDENIKNVA